MPSLVYQEPGKSSAITYELYKRITSIGGSDDNDVVIVDPALDDTHALVQFDGTAFTMQALSMTSDMVVNGKVRKRQVLEHGDQIRLGDTELKFQLYDEQVVSRDSNSDMSESYKRILEFSHKLLGQHELNELLEQVMDAIIELTDADKGFLILTEGEDLGVKVARNLDRENIDDAVAQLSDSIVTTVLETGRPLVVSDALNDAAFSKSMSVVNLKLCSVMCVPLVVRNETLGLIYVGNDNVVNLFTGSHLDALVIFASQISLIIANAKLLDDLRLDNKELREQLDTIKFGTIIGACDAMKGVYRRVDKVARTDVSVLIVGETGTGKELIAKEIHARSDRAKGPFITINCGAIPENLLESELFGHVRGAFTGATATRAGKFQAANGGTLFLDEIGEMPLNLQVKILRALQERTVTRVGESRPERVDIRVVAATHRDLKKMISESQFREDLYYRLNVVTLGLPPLRERGDDIVLIARYFLEKYVAEFDLSKKKFAKNSLIAMKKFAWPGNIRQLENAIKKAVILSERSAISSRDLDLPDDETLEIVPLSDARDAWQQQYIADVLAMNDGNRTKTARDLGVDPRTIFRFLEKHGSEAEEST